MALGTTALWIIAIVDGASLWSGLGLWAFISFAVWRFAYHPRAFIEGETLVIKNPVLTRRVPFEEIVACRSGYDGLVVERREGWNRTIWAVQKSNVMAWFGREVRSDRVAREIMDEVRRAGAN